ncbi:HAD family hydrolase [Rubellimicrobium roseum]|uniref:HAD-IA family hydrolase n=1 Tax=Rubellimicrobium roseum TaxID=687525 RepID=A0A5C4NEV7_9RHOB|nr:HAD family hydrolase [Rubellimicrobium roseum]TNC73304.1 HAD-IA family hydrolase [Rubellimicrobium roseum]
MTPDLVIFDCDGVLIDSEVISAQVLVEVAAEAGLHFDQAYVRDHFQGRSFPAVAQSIRESFGVTLPPDFEATYRERLLARFETDLRPTEGIDRVLDRLLVPACVATSSSPPRAARSLAITGLDRRLPRVFTASQVARGKPAPDLFLLAAREMGVPPSRCLVIEDSRPGLEAAQAAGMEVALYAGGSHLADLDGAGLARLFDIGPGLLPFRNWTDLAAAYPGLLAIRPHLEPAP